MVEIIGSSSNIANEFFNSPNAFRILFLHKGLKKAGLRQWGYTTTITLVFKDYQYWIAEDPLGRRIAKSYRELLNESDYSDFINGIVKRELKEIEKKLGNI